MIKKNIYHTICGLLLLAACHGYGQNRAIDSLKAVLQTQEPTDTARMMTLNYLVRQLRNIDSLEQGLRFAAQTVGLGEMLLSKTDRRDSVLRKKIKAETAFAWNHQGEIYRVQGIYPKAMECYLKLLVISEEIHHERGMAVAQNNMGIVFDAQKNYEEALRCFYEAMKIRDRASDLRGLASTYNNIGAVLISQGKLIDGLNYYIKARKVFEDTRDESGLASVLNNMGMIYEKMGDEVGDRDRKRELYEEALSCHWKSLELKRKIPNQRGIAVSLNNMGILFFKTERFDAADTCLSRSLLIAQNISDRPLVGDAYGSLGQYNSARGDFYSARGDHKKAAEYYRNAYGFREKQRNITEESLNDENVKKIFQMQFQYRQEKLDRIRALEELAKEEKRNAEAERQRIIMYAILGGLLLTLCLSFFIYKGYRQKQRANVEISAQKQLIEEKQKEILDSIHYARRIQRSLLPTEKYLDRALQNLRRK